MKQMEWIPFNEAVEVVKKIERLDWILDFSRKYIKIHIDTRDLRCLLMDRDNNIFTQKTYESMRDGICDTYDKHFNKKKDEKQRI